MIYNPIFEEEAEKKEEFSDLKKAIRKRAQKEQIKRAFNRVYNLLRKDPISTDKETSES